MTKDEILLYELSELSLSDPKYLDSPEIEVFYEDANGNEGSVDVCIIGLAERAYNRLNGLFNPKWLPTSENINSLPEPVRNYIHDLISNTDPANMVSENTLLRDQTRMLDAKIAKLKKELDNG